MSWLTNNQKIQIARRQLAISDDAYRAMLQEAAGVQSAKELDFQGQMKVLHRLKQLGFKPKRTYGPKSNKRAKPANKLRALWIEMGKDGLIRDGSEKALQSYVQRMTKGKYMAPNFCDDATASSLIESLKQWRKRLMRQAQEAGH